MSEANIRSYPSISDGRLLAILETLLQEWLATEIEIRLFGDTSHSLQSAEDAKSVKSELQLTNTKLISTATIVNDAPNYANNMFIDFRRAKTTWVTQSNPITKKLVPSQFEVEVEVRKPGVFMDKALEVMRAFEDAISAGKSVPEAAIPNEMLSALATHTEAFAAASAKTFDDARTVRLEAEQEISKLRKQQEQEFAARKALADQDLETLRKRIVDREAKLEKRIKEVDDRTNMHARRAKAQQIGSRLESRLEEESVGADVRSTRNLITRLSISALGFSALVVLSGLVEFIPNFFDNSNLNTQIFASARIAGGSAAFFLVLFYLLTFLRRIAAEDTAIKQQLERYSLDMDRSSWAIETVLEVQARSDNVKVPDEWMEGVTNNLFGDSSREDEEKTALEALGEILQRGAAFKMGSDGIELDLSSKAAKRVGNTGT